MKDIPTIMKAIAAVFVTSFLLIFSEISFPMYMVSVDSSVSAVMVPMRTSVELYWVANMAEVICVLSPHSDMNISVNPDRNVFLRWSLFSFCDCFCMSRSVPRIMKMVPEAIFR